MKTIRNFPTCSFSCDDEDFPVLSRFSWHYQNYHTWPYTAYKVGHITHNLPITMFLTINRHWKQAIPKNGNFQDCQKANIQLVNMRVKKQNNRKTKEYMGGPPSSKYKGVCKVKWKDYWRAYINLKVEGGVGEKRKRQISLGCHYSEEEAALAYNEKAIELYGTAAFQNIITSVI